jgi:hypothetical protein
MKEKSKHVNLAQQNGFVSAFLHTDDDDDEGKRHSKA